MAPLVLLPGLMCDARLFGPQLNALAGVYTLHSGLVSGFSTMQKLAADVLTQAPARFALAGLSMGGIVAMEIIAQAPERVERLALLDTNPKPEAVDVQAWREDQINRATSETLEEIMREELKPNYLAMGPNKQDALNLCMDMALGLGIEVFIRQSRAIQSRPDQQQTLRCINIPTLILCGADDKLCPVKQHQHMHDLVPGSHLHVIEGAGHLPTIEQPEQTTAALTRWMEM